MFRLIASDKATTMGHIKRKHLKEAIVFIPNNKILDMMDKIINPLFDKYIVNSLEVQTLTKIRDTLLPKLITGKIRVKP